MDATGDQRSTRQRAIDGLRMLAQMEEYVAAEIDELGYYAQVAAALRDSAAGRRLAAGRLEHVEPGGVRLCLVD